MDTESDQYSFFPDGSFLDLSLDIPTGPAIPFSIQLFYRNILSPWRQQDSVSLPCCLIPIQHCCRYLLCSLTRHGSGRSGLGHLPLPGSVGRFSTPSSKKENKERRGRGEGSSILPSTLEGIPGCSNPFHSPAKFRVCRKYTDPSVTASPTILPRIWEQERRKGSRME